jgi:CO/xanthine dehydrogenase Mo-binding subunit/aerobic-type carbon monoxide dehydrogenase small subunit (CoxS/CutS family)
MNQVTSVDLVVNGIARRLEVPPDQSLLDLLRDDLRLPGTKEGCDDGTCGTCTVMVDGKAVRACRTSAADVVGKNVLTIEGLGDPGHPHALQEAFVAADAVQCGFCTPGMIMAAAALLERNPRPSRSEIGRWLGSNLCRCTGYNSIVGAIEAAAAGGLPAESVPASEARDRGLRNLAGTGHRRLGAMDKATGRAVYAADLVVEGMLHAMAVRSPHPHAEIVAIDTERALRLDGVVAVLTARDVPGKNSYGRRLKDQSVLVEHRVRQLGDAVALVVATSPDVAAEALLLVDVEYRELPGVFSAEDALADGAPQIAAAGNLLSEKWLRLGDVAEGFARADVVVEETYTTPSNEHAYLEPEAALATWDGETLVVRTATQFPHYQRWEIATTMGLPVERVRVEPTVCGGAFGGKTEISCQCLAALAAYRTGKPVKIVYSRAESFVSTTKRHPFAMRCRAGATRDGEITALSMDILADTGAYASFGPGLMTKAFGSAAGPYRWPNVELHGRVAYTNNPSAGCMRGPGTTQVAFAVESQMDLLAARLGIDPLEFRERNRLRKGDRVLSGQILEGEPAYDETLAAVRPYWTDALTRCSEFNEAGGPLRHGVGLASIWYGIGGGGGGPVPGLDPAATVGRAPGRAAVDLLDDGSIFVRTSAMDLGQGSATAMALVAAGVLDQPLARVAAGSGDTSTSPDAGPTVGSRVTFIVGNAVRAAAESLREGILATASELLRESADGLELCDGYVQVRRHPETRVALSDVAGARRDAGLANTFDGYYDPELPAFDASGDLGEPYAMFVTGTQMAEVEVDTRSGEIRVLRMVAAHDVGRPVFAEGVVGQVEGGVAMGIGFALKEEFLPGETTGFKQYRIPRTRDVPEIVTILVGEAREPRELEMKGVGECSNMVTAPAITNAIAGATGYRVVSLPARLPGPHDGTEGRP